MPTMRELVRLGGEIILVTCLLFSVTAGDSIDNSHKARIPRCKGNPLFNITYIQRLPVQEASESREIAIAVLELLEGLHWKTIIVLYDVTYLMTVRHLLEGLEEETSFITVLLKEAVLNSDVQVNPLLQNLHQQFSPNQQFVLVANYDTTLSFLRLVERYDLDSNRTTDFRHKSLWVVACHTSCEPTTSLLPGIHQLEHVALVSAQSRAHTVLRKLLTCPGGRTFSAGISFTRGIKEWDIFPNTRHGLNNRTLLVSTLVDHPYVMVSNNGYEGYFIDFLNTIAADMNFSYKIVQAEDEQWGQELGNTWDGLVGQLERREVDLAIATLTIHEDREKVMDFLRPPTFSRVDDIMYRQLPEEDKTWRMYLKPFTPVVLLVLLATFNIISVVTFVLFRCEGCSMGKPRFEDKQTPREENQKFTMNNIFMYLFGTLLNRSVVSNPRMQSTRILLFTWGIFAIIVAASYSAHLVAIFTVQRSTPPFRSLGELVRQKEYKWGFTGGNIREHIFRLSKSVDMKRAWDGILEFNKTDPDVICVEESVHLAKMKTEKYAFITSRLTDNVSGHGCDIRYVGQNIIWHQYGIGVPTDYPLSEEIENVLSLIVDSGLPNIWWQRWGLSKRETCMHEDTVTSLTLPDVGSVLCLLGVGLGAAGVSLLVEIIKHKKYSP